MNQPERFRFVAFGDMPYEWPSKEKAGKNKKGKKQKGDKTTDDRKAMKRLLSRVAQLEPAFAVHVGDFKRGSSQCECKHFEWIRKTFTSFDGALLYTPGDNDWQDCKRKHQLDRDAALEWLREHFFHEDKSLGRKPLALSRQGGRGEFAEFVENTMFDCNGVTIGTIHVVGNETKLREKNSEEHLRRVAANVAWLRELFVHAGVVDAAAVVILTHANMRFYSARKHRAGFEEVLECLDAHVRRFDRPVLMVHGDKHRFLIDRPPLHRPERALALPNAEGPRNFTRIQVMGAEANVHGVLITVRPGHEPAFDARAIVIPQNLTRDESVFGATRKKNNRTHRRA